LAILAPLPPTPIAPNCKRSEEVLVEAIERNGKVEEARIPLLSPRVEEWRKRR